MADRDAPRAARPTTLTPSRDAAEEFRPAPTELPPDEAGDTHGGRSLPARVIQAARAGLGRRARATSDDTEAVLARARAESGARLGHARRAMEASTLAGGGRDAFGPASAAAARAGGTTGRGRRMARRKTRRIGLFRLVLIMAVAGALGSWLGLRLQDAFNDMVPKTTFYGTEKPGERKPPSSQYTF